MNTKIFPFKYFRPLFLFSLIFLGQFARSEETQTGTVSAISNEVRTERSVRLAYTSWQETFTLASPSTQYAAVATFQGYGFVGGYDRIYPKHWGCQDIVSP